MDSNLGVNGTGSSILLFNVAGAGNIDKSAPAVKPIGSPSPDAAKKTEAVLTIPQTHINYDPNLAKKRLQSAIETLNKQVMDKNSNLNFSYDESLKIPVVKVINSTTGDLVRQIPTEQILKFAHNLDQLKGVLFNGEY